ncbi:MAG: hypothetical protein CBC03_12100 [Pseudoalteromonas sp. TMED43]|nr:MAG: hypothetical protein CBC03_12100 [Pseudoalteromonas sp. TMED43]|tara:strand:- start:1322 stop:1861 length:540 start_codon:yes stop_codon:yes gene_type:complete
MDFKRTKQALELFAKAVKLKARMKLKKAKQFSSGKLHDSIDYNLNVVQTKSATNYFSLEFYMEDYGTFMDLGVKGSESTYPESKNSPYKYKKGKFKMINPASLDKWTIQKNIAPRDKKGRFIDRKSLKYAIATSIYKKGLKGSKFFTHSFEEEFKNIDKEVQEAFGLDLNDFLIKTQVV